MELKIIEKKENPFLKRTDVKAELSFTGPTPSNDELTKAIAKNIGCKEEVVLMRKVDVIFGETKASVDAFVYDTKEQKDAITPLTKHIKKKLEEEQKKAEEDKQKNADADPDKGDKSELVKQTESANAAAERMEKATEELNAAEARRRLGGGSEAGGAKEEKVKTTQEAAKDYIDKNFANLR